MGTASKEESPAVPKCVSCLDVIRGSDALKLTCQSSHTLCGECSAIFCQSIMAEGNAAVAPNPKCTVCRAPIPALAFERTLPAGLLPSYLTYMMMQTLGEDELLLSCVSCNYSEVHVDDPPIFFCKDPECGAVHCLGCKFKFPPLDEEEDDDDEFSGGQALRETHLLCYELRDEKEAFDKAIVAGNGMPCPGCGVVGRKDGMCTHMICSGCEQEWCYLCGLSVDDCDKAPRTGDAADEPIYGHNEDWETNPLRCPMYINKIAEIDEDWVLSEDTIDSDGEYDDELDEEDFENLCLDKFHKWQALQKLKVRYQHSIVLSKLHICLLKFSSICFSSSLLLVRAFRTSLEKKHGLISGVHSPLFVAAVLATRKSLLAKRHLSLLA